MSVSSLSEKTISQCSSSFVVGPLLRLSSTWFISLFLWNTFHFPIYEHRSSAFASFSRKLQLIKNWPKDLQLWTIWIARKIFRSSSVLVTERNSCNNWTHQRDFMDPRTAWSSAKSASFFRDAGSAWRYEKKVASKRYVTLEFAMHPTRPRISRAGSNR